MTDMLINFVNHFDPNGPTIPTWPKYSSSNASLMTFLDGDILLEITEDTFRKNAMEYITSLFMKYPL